MPRSAIADSRRRRLGARVIVLLLLAVAAGGGYWVVREQAEAAERRALLSSAREAMPGHVLPQLQACLEKHPNDPELLQAVVACMRRGGSTLVELEPFVDRWCAAAPADVAALRERMDIQARLAKPDQATSAGERILELDPGDQTTRLLLSAVYMDAGRFADAARELRHLNDAGRNGPEIVLALARAEWEQDHATEAARLVDEYLSRVPDDASALVLRGLIHHRAGEYESAVAVLQRERSRAPQHRAMLLFPLGQSLDRLGRSAEAGQAYAELAAIQDANRFATDAAQRPDDLPLQIKAAGAMLQAGDPLQARRVLEAALARLGSHRDALAELAKCYDALGQSDLAKQARAQAARAPR
jgi:tetratricopeptide (TPR) repeat protein